METMSLWHRVCKTDPAHVKPITGKQYSGNSPKPYYIVERLTQEFGPCGIGWGFTVLSERMERLSDTDVLHIAHVRFWYDMNGKRGEFDQMGQTKAVYEKSKGGLMVDEDAPKKSVTDALVKCASYLGFAGDIFSGRWDDSKYVAELRAEFGEAQKISAGVIKGTDGAMERLDEEVQAYIRAMAARLPAAFDKLGVEEVCNRLEREALDDDQFIALWALLPSNVRSGIKKEQEKRRLAKTPPKEVTA